jgi:hypothetical protein
MPHALGLDDRTLPRPDTEQTTGRQRRQHHFIRDGEVPVTTIRRHDASGEPSRTVLSIVLPLSTVSLPVPNCFVH